MDAFVLRQFNDVNESGLKSDAQLFNDMQRQRSLAALTPEQLAAREAKEALKKAARAVEEAAVIAKTQAAAYHRAIAQAKKEAKAIAEAKK